MLYVREGATEAVLSDWRVAVFGFRAPLIARTTARRNIHLDAAFRHAYTKLTGEIQEHAAARPLSFCHNVSSSGGRVEKATEVVARVSVTTSVQSLFVETHVGTYRAPRRFMHLVPAVLGSHTSRI